MLVYVKINLLSQFRKTSTFLFFTCIVLMSFIKGELFREDIFTGLQFFYLFLSYIVSTFSYHYFILKIKKEKKIAYQSQHFLIQNINFFLSNFYFSFKCGSH